jgi:hypothetical protein
MRFCLPLVLVCLSGLPCVLCFCLILFSEIFLSLFTSSLIFFLFSSLIHLPLYVYCSLFHFGVYLGLLCIHVFLFLCLIFFIFRVVKFLECTLYILVTTSSNFSMKFLVISCKISSLSVLLWASLCSLV